MAQRIQRKTAVQLKDISVSTIPGLTDTDVREYETLGFGSLQSLMTEMEARHCNLTGLSTTAIVIDKEQSERTCEGILAHPDVPQSFKDKWEVIGAPITPADVAQAHAQGNSNTPAQPGGVVYGFKRVVSLGFWNANPTTPTPATPSH